MLYVIFTKVKQIVKAPTLSEKGQVTGEVIGLISLLIGALLILFIFKAFEQATNPTGTVTANLVRDTFIPLVVLVAGAMVILGIVVSLKNGGGQ